MLSWLDAYLLCHSMFRLNWKKRNGVEKRLTILCCGEIAMEIGFKRILAKLIIYAQETIFVESCFDVTSFDVNLLEDFVEILRKKLTKEFLITFRDNLSMNFLVLG